MPSDMLERCARALDRDLRRNGPHGCRYAGGPDLSDVVIDGHVDLHSLARAVLREAGVLADDPPS